MSQHRPALGQSYRGSPSYQYGTNYTHTYHIIPQSGSQNIVINCTPYTQDNSPYSQGGPSSFPPSSGPAFRSTHSSRGSGDRSQSNPSRVFNREYLRDMDRRNRGSKEEGRTDRSERTGIDHEDERGRNRRRYNSASTSQKLAVSSTSRSSRSQTDERTSHRDKSRGRSRPSRIEIGHTSNTASRSSGVPHPVSLSHVNRTVG